jgi:uncharacterized membrane protein
MKISWRNEIAAWVILFGMFLLAALSWSWAPDAIPIHWNIRGEVDSFGGKLEGLLLLPFGALVVYIVFLIIPKIDPSRTDFNVFGKAYGVIRLLVLIFLALVYGMIHLWIRGLQISVSTFLPLIIGGLFIGLGNYMGKMRSNWFVGIRTPWTLSSKSTWAKTHRLGGWLFIGSGFFTILTGILLNRWAFAVLLVTGLGGTVWAFVYSYLVWRKAPDRVERNP